jgi:hypothetical protein
MIPTLEEQSLVIGDVMKNIDELYSSRYSFENSLEHELENGIKEIQNLINRKNPSTF